MKMQQLDWAISRMRRICEIWERKLDDADKQYILRRIRDKEPLLFYRIAREE